MGNFFRSLIRASSFLRKEIFEILRQPRLVATLVLGPFLILFIFGIGYRDQSRSLRTLFVVPPNSAIAAQDIQKYGKSMGSLITYEGVIADLNVALDRLHRGEVDLVIEEPGEAITTIQNNQQATFTLYHNQIDPVQVSYINYLGWLYVGAVNQQVLYAFAVQGQKDAVTLHASLQEAHKNVSATRQAVQSGDQVLAQENQLKLAGNVDTISLAAGASLGLLDSLQQTNSTSAGNVNPVQAVLTDLQQNTGQAGNSTGTKDERLANLDKIDQDITSLDGKLTEFQSVSPAILVSPFRSETKNEAKAQPTLLDFFIPAVLALLLQHVAVTFAALSIVRERNVGTMELFSVSPLSAAEALFGKYVSYMLFGGVIAAILSALLVFVLHVPLLGNWWYFALVISAVLFTSLGIGFVISIISQTDSQAVQYSMIILLASVFFSGFILGLDKLLPVVKVISWMLPTTYGTVLLRDIVLRGVDPNWWLLGGLIAIGLALMLVSWQLMRRLIASSL
jgi:ABC-2 type transport system permease protein